MSNETKHYSTRRVAGEYALNICLSFIRSS